ncbi:hypothetical protein Bca4012_058629 [Brassica carinata]
MEIGLLKFECKVGFDNGDIVKVTIQYEDLYRHSFSCKRISHEDGTFPELNDEQRERNQLSRIAQHDMEERATRKAFSQPQRPRAETGKEIQNPRIGGREHRGKGLALRKHKEVTEVMKVMKETTMI